MARHWRGYRFSFGAVERLRDADNCAFLERTLPLFKGEKEGVLRGHIGSPGSVTGRARVIRAADLAGADIEPGDILVTDMTTPDFLPLMMVAGGVTTAWGGILSHAAIVCRELKKPCVTNVKGVFDRIENGMMVEIDGNTGNIRVL
jgi:pyruvate,water dikinase